jgi:hypothetical protein
LTVARCKKYAHAAGCEGQQRATRELVPFPCKGSRIHLRHNAIITIGTCIASTTVSIACFDRHARRCSCIVTVIVTVVSSNSNCGHTSITATYLCSGIFMQRRWVGVRLRWVAVEQTEFEELQSQARDFSHR